MSINLVAIDLTSATTGTSGKVLLPLPVVQVDELAHLRVYNESGCGLTILFDNGHQEVIPAGAWPMFEIEPQVRSYTWTVTYVLPNAPVALVSAVYYFPYEGVPPTPALGNSPIGVTGGVTTSSVQTLSNETAILGTKIVDIGTLTIADLLDIFNDHFIWSVQQGGVAHQVLKGQTSGNPLQVGQAGDTSEVLGSLTVDQALTATANASSIVSKANLLTSGANLAGGLGVSAANDVLDASGPSDLYIKAAGGNFNFQSPNGTTIFTVRPSGPALLGSTVFNLLTGSLSRLKMIAVTAPVQAYPGTFTVTHNFGFVPVGAWYHCGQAANVDQGSATTEVHNWGTNTCTVRLGAQVNGTLFYLA